MKIIHIPTRLGTIAAAINVRDGTLPIIFLHGVYLDRRLWDAQVAEIHDRTVITLDMPGHGASSDAPAQWSLEDCAEMLIEVLDYLALEEVIAIGHSWGSMTILRAAVKQPQRFAAVGFGNMPLAPGNLRTMIVYAFQSLLLPFRSFYAEQAAKALFAPDSLRAHPEFVAGLKQTMGRLSNQAMRRLDLAVVINPDDGFAIARQLRVPALALRGEHDYVPDPPGLSISVVPGGHTSPLEAPQHVRGFIQHVIQLAEAHQAIPVDRSLRQAQGTVKPSVV